MKKIYLLSAVACLFAFNANAYETEKDGWVDGWGGDNSAKTVLSVSGTLTIDVAEGNDYSHQLISCSWQGLEGQEEGNAFELTFEVCFHGADSASFGPIMAGKTHPWTGDFDQGGNLQVVNEKGESLGQGYGQAYASHGVKIGSDWKTISYKGFVGKWGADSIRMQINLGGQGNNGQFEFRNIKLLLDEKVVKEWFTVKEGGDGSAIAEEAAVKAFVANNVIFASEAADVVVYNISGVAVKSAKNVTSLDVADLKAGLYIAKVGNATVKFVK